MWRLTPLPYRQAALPVLHKTSLYKILQGFSHRRSYRQTILSFQNAQSISESNKSTNSGTENRRKDHIRLQILTLHFDEPQIHSKFLSLRFPPHTTPQILCSSLVSTPDLTCCSPQPCPSLPFLPQAEDNL